MGTLVRFIAVMFMKLVFRCLYRFNIQWVGKPPYHMKYARAGVFLNHTSLFEPIFVAALDRHVLWRFAKEGILPVADITLDRPLVGFLYRMLSAESVESTRKRDSTWQDFLDRIKPKSLVLIAPEGRMKRRTGLDKEGKPMTVRAGIADVLLILKEGPIILTYSGGLHHIQAPGDRLPRLFKTVCVRFERVMVEDYIKEMGGAADHKEFRKRVVADLERRRDLYAHPFKKGDPIPL